MFDLEQALASWRHRLSLNPVFLPDDIEELEGHLRDLVLDFTISGWSEKEAFDWAMKKMGDYRFVEKEYRKVRWSKPKRRRRFRRSIYWEMIMLKNQLKTVFRTLRSQKGYAILNIAGLSVGIALSILALLYVQHEHSFDRSLSKADRIYRVVQDINIPNQQSSTAWVGVALAQSLLDNFPEVSLSTRITGRGSVLTLQYRDKRFKINKPLSSDGSHFVVDRSILNMFDIEIIRGDSNEPFPTYESFVISESMARKIFGEEDPVGEILTLTGPFIGSNEILVAAVARDMPANSHFQFDFLDLINPIPDERLWNASWGGDAAYTYIVLPENYPPERLEEKFPAFVDRILGPEMGRLGDTSWEEIKASGGGWTLHLQALKDIHLDTQYEAAFWRQESRTKMGFFSIIAFFILVLACVNFMNLATARSSRRIKEVGIRKVVGSSRTQLIHQFLLESVIISLLSLLVACVLVMFLLPAFNAFLGTEVSFDVLENAYLLPGLIVLALTVGVLAGSYPAFFLSSFRPVELFSGARRTGARGVSLRDGLVVFQFLITVLLIVATLVVYSQLSFMRDKDLGFDGEQVIVLQDISDAFLRAEGPNYVALLAKRGYSADEFWALKRPQRRELMDGEDGIGRFPLLTASRMSVFKQRLLEIPGIQSASMSNAIPGRVEDGGFKPRRSDPSGGGEPDIRVLGIDSDFLETLQLELVAGRNMSDDEGAFGSFLINETAARIFGSEYPLGSTFSDLLLKAGYQALDATNRPIVGVLKDFQSFDMHTEVLPMVFWLMQPPGSRHMIVRVQSGDLQATLASMERTWNQFIPDDALTYSFLDEDFARLFEAETRLSKAFGFFATLAIIIACLGLFGLAAFMAEQRTKEIGIRKTLGASVRNIVQLLSRHFLWLLLIGNLIAWPIGYIAMNRWLENFAFRVDIGMSIFVLTGAVALVLVVISVGGQALRASLANPVDSIRYE